MTIKKCLCTAYQHTWEVHSSVHPKVGGLDCKGGDEAREVTAAEVVMAEKAAASMTFLAEEVKGEGGE